MKSDPTLLIQSIFKLKSWFCLSIYTTWKPWSLCHIAVAKLSFPCKKSADARRWSSASIVQHSRILTNIGFTGKGWKTSQALERWISMVDIYVCTGLKWRVTHLMKESWSSTWAWTIHPLLKCTSSSCLMLQCKLQRGIRGWSCSVFSQVTGPNLEQRRT